MRRVTAATTALVGSVCLALAMVACTAAAPDLDRASPSPSPSPTEPPVLTAELRLPTEATTVLDATDPITRAAATSAALFASAPIAVLAPADDVVAQVRAAAVAVALGAPLLLDAADPDVGSAGDPTSGPEPTPGDEATGAELERLGVVAVLTVGRARAQVAADVTVLEAPADDTDLTDLLRVELERVPAPAAGHELVAVAALDRTAPTLPTGGPTDGAERSPTTSPSPTADVSPTTSLSTGPSTGPTTGPTTTLDRTPSPSASGQDDPDDQVDPGARNRLPLTELADPPEGGLVLTSGDPLDLAAVATARAAGVDVLTVPGGDPRATSATVQAIARAEPIAVVGLGPAFGTVDALGWKTSTAATGVELPGGGQLVFPGRRFVALYGTPQFAGLGVLGEQDISASITRAQGLAAEYQPLTEDVVVPAFEMIVTVASSGAGADGNYSNELPVDSFVPWIEAARDAGVYVVIDLQPGRTDFLTQARMYEPLLTYPNVGLALDPEWRLTPDQVHLRQIGSVGVDEINTVAAYLAELTRTERLPQKLLVLHQFMLRMIDGRERLDLSHPELALLIHADGQGSQGAKAGTWAALHQGAPDGLAWGWKNFIDEDSPMLTPAETYQVTPAPQFVSYQ